MPYIKSDGKRIVIALGGNALGNTPQEQLELVKHTAACIVDMVADGVNVVVSHGNGPQVGMINNAFAFASQHDEKTPEMPFPEAGAMSQGYIGYQLSQAILNELRRRGIMRSTANVVTQTVVSRRPGLPEPHQACWRLPDWRKRPRPRPPRPATPSRKMPAAVGARWLLLEAPPHR